MTRQVAKLSPNTILVPADKNPGDLVGVITGLVTGTPSRFVVSGGFDYHPQGGNEKTVSTLCHVPAEVAQWFWGATTAKPQALGVRVVVGHDGKPLFRAFTP